MVEPMQVPSKKRKEIPNQVRDDGLRSGWLVTIQDDWLVFGITGCVRDDGLHSRCGSHSGLDPESVEGKDQK